MGKTYAGNTSDESAIPKKIYVGNDSNLSVPCKVAYCGDSNGKSVEVWRDSTLPSTYQKVEYIYNTGCTQYINTGVKPNSDTRVEIDFMKINQDTYSEHHLFGCEIYNTSPAKKYSTDIVDNSPYCYFGNSSISLSGFSKNTRYTLVFNGNGGRFTLNGVDKGTSQTTFTALSIPIYLFGYSMIAYNGTQETRILKDGVYLYHFSVRQANSLIRDMYPCYLKSDSQTVGMYDLIGGQFYGNSGTGIFYKGPDIN